MRLFCPYCGAALEELVPAVNEGKGEFGIIGCECNEYPIVAGIPILISGPISESGVTAATIIESVRSKDFDNALLLLLRPAFPRNTSRLRFIGKFLPSYIQNRFSSDQVSAAWDKRMRHLVLEKRQTTAFEVFEHFFGHLGKNTPNTLDYFFYRFGQPRHLTALSLASIIEPSRGAVLDLGCGAGHITRYLCHKYNGQNVVGIDNHFPMLYIAKNFISPEADYVCCDGNIGLPFGDDSFASINCVNTFHFFEQKHCCVSEMQRVTQSDGLILLSALRHSLFQVGTPNKAISPKGYRNLWKDWPYTMISDSKILHDYLNKSTPDLTPRNSEEGMDVEPLISMVISKDGNFLQPSQPFDIWPHSLGCLTLNPLYRIIEETDDSIRLIRRYPSKFYAEENSEGQQYLPEAVTLPRGILSDGRAIDAPQQVKHLVDRCAVLDIPPLYE